MGGAMHSKRKGSKRVKLHRELAELLIKELRRHGTCGEMIGEWKDEGKDHDIVGPPMVIIMNTEHDKDDKHRKTMEENRIVRQRTKMQHQQNKEEMDGQDEFLKEQMNESIRNRLDVEEAIEEHASQVSNPQVEQMTHSVTDYAEDGGGLDLQGGLWKEVRKAEAAKPTLVGSPNPSNILWGLLEVPGQDLIFWNVFQEDYSTCDCKVTVSRLRVQ